MPLDNSFVQLFSQQHVQRSLHHLPPHIQSELSMLWSAVDILIDSGDKYLLVEFFKEFLSSIENFPALSLSTSWNDPSVDSSVTYSINEELPSGDGSSQPDESSHSDMGDLYDPLGVIKKLFRMTTDALKELNLQDRKTEISMLNILVAIGIKSGRASLLLEAVSHLLLHHRINEKEPVDNDDNQSASSLFRLSLLADVTAFISQNEKSPIIQDGSLSTPSFLSCISPIVNQQPQQNKLSVSDKMNNLVESIPLHSNPDSRNKNASGGIAISFGKADYGKLGHGDTVTHRQIPTIIESIRDVSLVKTISMSTYVIGLDIKGVPYVWGTGGSAAGTEHSQRTDIHPHILSSFPVVSSQHGSADRIECESRESVENDASHPYWGAHQPSSFQCRHVIKDVSCGLGHSLFLLSNGRVLSWGTGGNGRLGLGDLLDRTEATFITAFDKERIVNVQCGASHSLAVSSSAKVYCWGKNSRGQCGTGSTDDVLVPALTTTLQFEKLTQVAAGWEHSLALTKDGRLYSWGCGYKDNRRGVIPPVLGLGHNEARSVPELLSSLIVPYPPSLLSALSVTPPASTVNNVVITKVSSGWDHCLALDSLGRVFSWGSGQNGKLGTGNEENVSLPCVIPSFEGLVKVVLLSTGCEHSAVVTEEGHVYTWGHGDGGRLGHGDNAPRLEPMLVLPLLRMNMTPIDVHCGDKFTIIILNPEKSIASDNDESFGSKPSGAEESVVVPGVADKEKDAPPYTWQWLHQEVDKLVVSRKEVDCSLLSASPSAFSTEEMSNAAGNTASPTIGDCVTSTKVEQSCGTPTTFNSAHLSLALLSLMVRAAVPSPPSPAPTTGEVNQLTKDDAKPSFATAVIKSSREYTVECITPDTFYALFDVLNSVTDDFMSSSQACKSFCQASAMIVEGNTLLSVMLEKLKVHWAFLKCALCILTINMEALVELETKQHDLLVSEQKVTDFSRAHIHTPIVPEKGSGGELNGLANNEKNVEIEEKEMESHAMVSANPSFGCLSSIGSPMAEPNVSLDESSRFLNNNNDHDRDDARDSYSALQDSPSASTTDLHNIVSNNEFEKRGENLRNNNNEEEQSIGNESIGNLDATSIAGSIAESVGSDHDEHNFSQPRSSDGEESHISHNSPVDPCYNGHEDGTTNDNNEIENTVELQRVLLSSIADNFEGCPEDVLGNFGQALIPLEKFHQSSQIFTFFRDLLKKLSDHCFENSTSVSNTTVSVELAAISYSVWIEIQNVLGRTFNVLYSKVEKQKLMSDLMSVSSTTTFSDVALFSNIPGIQKAVASDPLGMTDWLQPVVLDSHNTVVNIWEEFMKGGHKMFHFARLFLLSNKIYPSSSSLFDKVVDGEHNLFCEVSCSYQMSQVTSSAFVRIGVSLLEFAISAIANKWSTPNVYLSPIFPDLLPPSWSSKATETEREARSLPWGSVFDQVLQEVVFCIELDLEGLLTNWLVPLLSFPVKSMDTPSPSVNISYPPVSTIFHSCCAGHLLRFFKKVLDVNLLAVKEQFHLLLVFQTHALKLLEIYCTHLSACKVLMEKYSSSTDSCPIKSMVAWIKYWLTDVFRCVVDYVACCCTNALLSPERHLLLSGRTARCFQLRSTYKNIMLHLISSENVVTHKNVWGLFSNDARSLLRELIPYVCSNSSSDKSPAVTSVEYFSMAQQFDKVLSDKFSTVLEQFSTKANAAYKISMIDEPISQLRILAIVLLVSSHKLYAQMAAFVKTCASFPVSHDVIEKNECLYSNIWQTSVIIQQTIVDHVMSSAGKCNDEKVRGDSLVFAIQYYSVKLKSLLHYEIIQIPLLYDDSCCLQNARCNDANDFTVCDALIFGVRVYGIAIRQWFQMEGGIKYPFAGQTAGQETCYGSNRDVYKGLSHESMDILLPRRIRLSGDVRELKVNLSHHTQFYELESSDEEADGTKSGVAPVLFFLVLQPLNTTVIDDIIALQTWNSICTASIIKGLKLLEKTIVSAFTSGGDCGADIVLIDFLKYKCDSSSVASRKSRTNYSPRCIVDEFWNSIETFDKCLVGVLSRVSLMNEVDKIIDNKHNLRQEGARTSLVHLQNASSNTLTIVLALIEYVWSSCGDLCQWFWSTSTITTENPAKLKSNLFSSLTLLVKKLHEVVLFLLMPSGNDTIDSEGDHKSACKRLCYVMEHVIPECFDSLRNICGSDLQVPRKAAILDVLRVDLCLPYLPEAVEKMCMYVSSAYLAIQQFMWQCAEKKITFLYSNSFYLQSMSPYIVPNLSSHNGNYTIGFWMKIPTNIYTFAEGSSETFKDIHLISRVPETDDFNLAELLVSKLPCLCHPNITLRITPQDCRIVVISTSIITCDGNHVSHLHRGAGASGKCVKITSPPLIYDEWLHFEVSFSRFITSTSSLYIPDPVATDESNFCSPSAASTSKQRVHKGKFKRGVLALSVNGQIIEQAEGCLTVPHMVYQSMIIGTMPVIFNRDLYEEVILRDVTWSPTSVIGRGTWTDKSTRTATIPTAATVASTQVPPFVLMESLERYLTTLKSSLIVLKSCVVSVQSVSFLQNPGSWKCIISQIPLFCRLLMQCIGLGDEDMHVTCFDILKELIGLTKSLEYIVLKNGEALSPALWRELKNKLLPTANNCFREVMENIFEMIHVFMDWRPSSFQRMSELCNVASYRQTIIDDLVTLVSSQKSLIFPAHDSFLGGNIKKYEVESCRKVCSVWINRICGANIGLDRVLNMIKCGDVMTLHESMLISCYAFVMVCVADYDTLQNPIFQRDVSEKNISEGSSGGNCDSLLVLTDDRKYRRQWTRNILRYVCAGGWSTILGLHRDVVVTPMSSVGSTKGEGNTLFISSAKVYEILTSPRLGVMLCASPENYNTYSGKQNVKFLLPNKQCNVSNLLVSTEICATFDCFAPVTAEGILPILSSSPMRTTNDLFLFLKNSIIENSSKVQAIGRSSSFSNPAMVTAMTAGSTGNPGASTNIMEVLSKDKNTVRLLIENKINDWAVFYNKYPDKAMHQTMCQLRSLLIQLARIENGLKFGTEAEKVEHLKQLALLQPIIVRDITNIISVAVTHPIVAISSAFETSTGSSVYRGTQLDVLKNLIRDADAPFLEKLSQRFWTKLRVKHHFPSASSGGSTTDDVERNDDDSPMAVSPSIPLPLVVLAGEVHITENRVKAVSHFPTLKLGDVAVERGTGRWFYEITLLTDGLMQIGWADSLFKCAVCGQGVGDHPHSWAFDGMRSKKWCVTCESYGRRWRVGDVVGVLVDTDLLEMRFFLNGDDLGSAFTEFKFTELHPAISLNARQCVRVNFGETLFCYPPDELDGWSYKGVRELIKSSRGLANDKSASVKAFQSAIAAEAVSGVEETDEIDNGISTPISSYSPDLPDNSESKSAENQQSSIDGVLEVAKEVEMSSEGNELGDDSGKGGNEVSNTGADSSPIASPKEKKEEDFDKWNEPADEQMDDWDGEGAKPSALDNDEEAEAADTKDRDYDEQSSREGDGEADEDEIDDPHEMELHRQNLVESLITLGFPIDWALRAAEHCEVSATESAAITWILERMETEQAKMEEYNGDSSRVIDEEDLEDNSGMGHITSSNIGGARHGNNTASPNGNSLLNMDPQLRTTLGGASSGVLLGGGMTQNAQSRIVIGNALTEYGNSDEVDDDFAFGLGGGVAGTTNQNWLRSLGAANQEFGTAATMDANATSTSPTIVRYEQVHGSQSSTSNNATESTGNAAKRSTRRRCGAGMFINDQGDEMDDNNIGSGPWNNSNQPPNIAMGNYAAQQMRYNIDKQEILAQVSDLEPCEVFPIVISCEYVLCTYYARAVAMRVLSLVSRSTENLLDGATVAAADTDNNRGIGLETSSTAKDIMNDFNLTMLDVLLTSEYSFKNLNDLMRVCFKQQSVYGGNSERLLPAHQFHTHLGASSSLSGLAQKKVPLFPPFSSNSTCALDQSLLFMEHFGFENGLQNTAGVEMSAMQSVSVIRAFLLKLMQLSVSHGQESEERKSDGLDGIGVAAEKFLVLLVQDCVNCFESAGGGTHIFERRDWITTGLERDIEETNQRHLSYPQSLAMIQQQLLLNIRNGHRIGAIYCARPYILWSHFCLRYLVSCFPHSLIGGTDPGFNISQCAGTHPSYYSQLISADTLTKILKVSVSPNISLKFCSFDLGSIILSRINIKYQPSYTIDNLPSDDRPATNKRLVDPLSMNLIAEYYVSVARERTFLQALSLRLKSEASLKTYSIYSKSICRFLIQWQQLRKMLGLFTDSHTHEENMAEDWNDKLRSSKDRLVVNQISSSSITVSWVLQEHNDGQSDGDRGIVPLTKHEQKSRKDGRTPAIYITAVSNMGLDSPCLVVSGLDSTGTHRIENLESDTSYKVTLSRDVFSSTEASRDTKEFGSDDSDVSDESEYDGGDEDEEVNDGDDEDVGYDSDQSPDFKVLATDDGAECEQIQQSITTVTDEGNKSGRNMGISLVPSHTNERYQRNGDIEVEYRVSAPSSEVSVNSSHKRSSDDENCDNQGGDADEELPEEKSHNTPTSSVSLYTSTVPEATVLFDVNTLAPHLVLSSTLLTMKNLSNKKWGTARATVRMTSGVHRWDVRIDRCISKNIFIGVCTEEAKQDNYVGCDRFGWAFLANRAVWHNKGKLDTFGELFHTGDTVSVILDCDKGCLSYGLNGADLGVAVDGLTAGQPFYAAFSLYNEDDQLSLIPSRASLLTNSEDCSGWSSSGAERVLDRVDMLKSSMDFICNPMAERSNMTVSASVGGGKRPILTTQLQDELYRRWELWWKYIEVRSVSVDGDYVSIVTSKSLCKEMSNGMLFPHDWVVWDSRHAMVIGCARHRIWFQFEITGELKGCTRDSLLCYLQKGDIQILCDAPNRISRVQRHVAETPVFEELEGKFVDSSALGEALSECSLMWTVVDDGLLVEWLEVLARKQNIHPLQLLPCNILSPKSVFEHMACRASGIPGSFFSIQQSRFKEKFERLAQLFSDEEILLRSLLLIHMNDAMNVLLPLLGPTAGDDASSVGHCTNCLDINYPTQMLNGSDLRSTLFMQVRRQFAFRVSSVAVDYFALSKMPQLVNIADALPSVSNATVGDEVKATVSANNQASMADSSANILYAAGLNFTVSAIAAATTSVSVASAASRSAVQTVSPVPVDRTDTNISPLMTTSSATAPGGGAISTSSSSSVNKASSGVVQRAVSLPPLSLAKIHQLPLYLTSSLQSQEYVDGQALEMDGQEIPVSVRKARAWMLIHKDRLARNHDNVLCTSILEILPEHVMARQLLQEARDNNVLESVLCSNGWKLLCGLQCSYLGQLRTYLDQLASMSAVTPMTVRGEEKSWEDILRICCCWKNDNDVIGNVGKPVASSASGSSTVQTSGAVGGEVEVSLGAHMENSSNIDGCYCGGSDVGIDLHVTSSIPFRIRGKQMRSYHCDDVEYMDSSKCYWRCEDGYSPPPIEYATWKEHSHENNLFLLLNSLELSGPDSGSDGANVVSEWNVFRAFLYEALSQAQKLISYLTAYNVSSLESKKTCTIFPFSHRSAADMQLILQHIYLAGAVLGIALRLNLHPQMTFSLLQVSQLLGDSLRCSPVDGKASMSSTVIENNTEFQTCWLMSLRNGLLSTYPEEGLRLLTPKELYFMICGANVFDVPHIQRNVLLELPTAHLCDGYISIYKMFWTAMVELPPVMRRGLLRGLWSKCNAAHATEIIPGSDADDVIEGPGDYITSVVNGMQWFLCAEQQSLSTVDSSHNPDPPPFAIAISDDGISGISVLACAGVSWNTAEQRYDSSSDETVTCPGLLVSSRQSDGNTWSVEAMLAQLVSITYENNV